MTLVSPIYRMKHLKDRFTEKYLRQALSGQRNYASPPRYKINAKCERRVRDAADIFIQHAIKQAKARKLENALRKAG